MNATILTMHLSNRSVEVEVTQELGELVLHPMPLEENKEKARKAWTITHRPSGRFLVTGIRKKTDAVNLLGACSLKATELGVDLSLPLEQMITQPSFIEWSDWLMGARSEVQVLKDCEL